MKAVQISTYGGADVLVINENAPKPNPSKNQVLVETHAASIKNVDAVFDTVGKVVLKVKG